MDKSLVSISKCEDYSEDNLYNSISYALNLLGGIDFVKNKTVLLKPNFLAPKPVETAVTTNTNFIIAIAKIIINNGGRVIIGDSPGIGTANIVSKIIGLDDFINNNNNNNNVRLTSFKDTIEKGNNKCKIIKSFSIASIYDEVDYIFNLPKLKTHGMTKYTGAVKNMFGIIPGLAKPKYHFKYPNKKTFSQMLVDLNLTIKPKLVMNIMDAIIGMEGNGPGSGNPRKIGLVLASADSVALDSVACKIINLNPNDIYTNVLGQESNLGNMDNVDFIGVNYKDYIIKDFKHIKSNKELSNVIPLPKFVKKSLTEFFSEKPFINYNKCILCEECIKICPSEPKSLEIKNKKVLINRKTCIRCFCCQEICPVGAIDIKRFKLQ